MIHHTVVKKMGIKSCDVCSCMNYYLLLLAEVTEHGLGIVKWVEEDRVSAIPRAWVVLSPARTCQLRDGVYGGRNQVHLKRLY